MIQEIQEEKIKKRNFPDAPQVHATDLFLAVIVNVVSFFPIWDFTSSCISSLLPAVVYMIQKAAILPCFAAILSKTYYGQFSSANAPLRAAFTAGGDTGGGILFDRPKDRQCIYAWNFLFTIGSAVLLHGPVPRLEKSRCPDHDCTPYRRNKPPFLPGLFSGSGGMPSRRRESRRYPLETQSSRSETFL